MPTTRPVRRGTGSGSPGARPGRRSPARRRPAQRHGDHRLATLRRTAIVVVLIAVVVGVLQRCRADTATVVGVHCEVTQAKGGPFEFEPEQTAHAATIAAVAVRRRLPTRAAVIAIATAMQESKLRNLDYGDRDSLGLFQQRPSQGWGTPAQIQDPVYASGMFYDHLVTVKNWQSRPLTQVAQAVQRSGYPEAYAQHEAEATALATALSGDRPGALGCALTSPDRPRTPAAVAAALKKEFGLTGPKADTSSVTASTDTTRGAWAVGSWAVAHADEIGATKVVVGNRRWQRGQDEKSLTWDTADLARAERTVVITLAVAPA